MPPRTALDVGALIASAFASAPRPASSAITDHRCPECDTVASLLAPHTAADVPEEVLDYLGDSLPLLSPVALRYYLPAYLNRALASGGFRWIDFLIYHLSPSRSDFAERGEYWRERLAVFSQHERAAVLGFVEWMLENHSVGREYTEELVRARSIWAQQA